MNETEDLEAERAVAGVEPPDGSMPPWLPDAIKLAGKRLGFALFAAGISILVFLYLVDQLSSFLTMIGIPLSYSIADGLALGFISYPIIKLFSGKGREVGVLTYLQTADIAFVKSAFTKEHSELYVPASMIGFALAQFAGPLSTVMFPRIVRSAARSEAAFLSAS